LRADKSYYMWERYGESKIANIMFTQELNRRMQSQGHHVISAAVHPGLIESTNFIKDKSMSSQLNLLGSIKLAGLWEVLSERKKTIPEGAATTVLTALSPNVVPGAYYADCQPSEHYHKQAKDAANAVKLWKISEDFVASKK